MTDATVISISPVADVADIPNLHAAILHAFESGGPIHLALENPNDPLHRVSPLVLQLLVSASRTVQADRLRLNPAAAAEVERCDAPQRLHREV